jgi:hypothetical protein
MYQFGVKSGSVSGHYGINSNIYRNTKTFRTKPAEKNKKKIGKAVPVHNMKACRRSRGITPLILYLGNRYGEWPTSSPVRFTPRKQLRYPLNRRVCGSRAGMGVLAKEKIFYS